MSSTIEDVLATEEMQNAAILPGGDITNNEVVTKIDAVVNTKVIAARDNINGKIEPVRNRVDDILSATNRIDPITKQTGTYQNISASLMDKFPAAEDAAWKTTLKDLVFEPQEAGDTPDINTFFENLKNKKDVLNDLETSLIGNAQTTLQETVDLTNNLLNTNASDDVAADREAMTKFITSMVTSLNNFETAFAFTDPDGFDLVGPLDEMSTLVNALPDSVMSRLWSIIISLIGEEQFNTIPDTIDRVADIKNTITPNPEQEIGADLRPAVILIGGRLTNIIGQLQHTTDALPISLSVDLQVGGSGGVAFGGNATGKVATSGGLEVIAIIPAIFGFLITTMETVKTMFELAVELYDVPSN